jgi:chaperonin GroEL
MLRAEKALDALTGLEEDERLGVAIVRKILDRPIRTIAENAGFEAAEVVVDVRSRKGSIGFNAETGEIEDLFKAGILDPTKVVRTALENAASIGGLILTTEALVAEKPEEEESDSGAAE